MQKATRGVALKDREVAEGGMCPLANRVRPLAEPIGQAPDLAAFCSAFSAAAKVCLWGQRASR
jgi:hypothetical protein